MNQNVFKLRLANVMKDISFARWQGGMRRGKLDHRSLAKIAVNSNRIFRQKVETDSHQHHVLFLLDISGSMWNWKTRYEGTVMNRFDAAYRIVEFLCKALEENGIDYGCLAFNEVVFPYKVFGDGRKAEVWMKRMMDHTYLMRRVDYPSKVYHTDGDWSVKDSCKDMLSVLSRGQQEELLRHAKGGGDMSFTAGNADILAIREAKRVVGNVPGKTMVIVISDGMPRCDESNGPSKGIHYGGKNTSELKVEIQELEQSTKVFAVNVGEAALADFYSHYSTAKTADNVRQDMVSFLTANISR